MERTSAAILAWSWWRRWHQAQARAAHYRRRHQDEPLATPASGMSMTTSLMDRVWGRLAAVLRPPGALGRPVVHDRRLVLEAIVFVMQTGCAWRALPDRFPPWQTVYAQLCCWQESGI